MSPVKNQKTGFSISDFKNSLQNSIYFVKLALAGFFFPERVFFFFSLYIEPKMNCLINPISAYIAKHKQIFYFSFVPGPGEYFK